MTDLVFTLSDELDEKSRQQFLAAVEGLPGVLKASPLRLNSDDEEMRRTYFAQVASGSDITKVIRRIRGLHSVELIAEQPVRRAKTADH